ncbi:macro domain-containing protein [Oceanisphaera sp.]|uniref:macro domain-containing protein n=1 Tax=Oceanisphaera sp. TaxID=1929979 RepID=UPI003A8F0C34
MNNIEILEGDITTAHVDIIVNAANPVMLGGGGVDGAIHRAAGPGLLEECRKVKAVNGIRCPTGEARITPAGLLQAKYVVHTVGPVFKLEQQPGVLLESCYRQCLELALSYNCQSIAFPAISCGAYGYPITEAANIAFGVCGEPRYNDLNIYFYLYGKDTLKAWTTAYAMLST